MHYYNGQSACDIGNPVYHSNRLKPARYRKGICSARIYCGTEDEYVDVLLAYEAEDNGDGYEVYIERPEVSGASDLLQDVSAALECEGLYNLARITWL